MKIDFLIPARGGSKRIPRKNIRMLCGKPLISYVVTAASKTKCGDVWVSTDDDTIAEIASEFGAKIIKRPSAISGDLSSLEEVIDDFIQHVKTEIVVVCEPTNPLTTSDDLEKAIETFGSLHCDSLVCLQKGKVFIWETFGDGCAKPISYDYKNRKRVQDFDFSQYQYEEGGVYITSADAFKKSHSRLSGKIGFYTIPHQSINIDDLMDLEITAMLLEHGGNRKDESK